MRKYEILIVIVLIALMAGGCVGTSGMLDPYEKQIELGYKLIADGKYDEAILAFNRAIKIDVKKEKAYIGIADTYANRGGEKMVEDVNEVLRRGFEQSKSSLIADTYIRIADELIGKDKADWAIQLLDLGYDVTKDEVMLKKWEGLKKTSVTDSDEVQSDQEANLMELSGYYIGEIPAKNLMYKLRQGDLNGNHPEGFLGYTDITFDIDLSSTDPKVAGKIKECLIADWKDGSFTDDELVYTCKYYTGMWGNRGLEGSEAITKCSGGGFPTYEKDRGKEFEVCLVLCDDQSAAIGYCLVNVAVPVK